MGRKNYGAVVRVNGRGQSTAAGMGTKQSIPLRLSDCRKDMVIGLHELTIEDGDITSAGFLANIFIVCNRESMIAAAGSRWPIYKI